MPVLFWDASSLVKRYYIEIGSPTVNAIFAFGGDVIMATTYLCYAETCAVLRRKFNQGVFNQSDFNAARTQISREVLNNHAFELMSIDDSAVLSGISLTDNHNINSTDAAILATFLRNYTTGTYGALSSALVTSDQRLLR